MDGVLIQAGQQNVMLVTLPGFQVETATIDQTCFDSRWSGFSPYALGQLTSGNDNPATFSFGETLDQPPMCLSHFVTLNPGGAPTTVFENTPTMLRGGGTDQWWYVLVTTSFLQFRSKFGGQSSRLTFKLFKRIAG